MLVVLPCLALYCHAYVHVYTCIYISQLNVERCIYVVSGLVPRPELLIHWSVLCVCVCMSLCACVCMCVYNMCAGVQCMYVMVDCSDVVFPWD